MKFAVALLLLLSVHLGSTNDCQDGWQVFQNNCYLFVPDKVTWYGGLYYCEKKHQAKLPVVKSAVVDQWIKAQMDNHSIKELWTDAYYEHNGGYWKWVSIKARISGYFNFGVQQPKKTSNEYCLWLKAGANNKWIDGLCYNKIPYACQKPVATLTGEFLDKNYTFHKIAQTWEAAKAFCEKNHAHLPNVSNEEVQQWLAEQMDKHSIKQMWLGGKNLPKRAIWEWLPSRNLIGYSNWAVGKPTNVFAQRCLAVSSALNHKWEDVVCDSKIAFACQRPAIYQWGDYQSNSYTLHREAKTWAEAKDSCAENQAQLLVVKNEGIDRWLSKQMDKYSLKELWLGGHYVTNGSLWDWKQSEEQVRYIFNCGIYYSFNNGMENCLVVGRVKWPGSRYEWNDCDCYDVMFYICQKPGQ